MNAPRFIALDAARIHRLASRFREEGARRVVDVHVHATHDPSIAEFTALVEAFGGRSELASQAVCRRLWQRHTVHRGWSHSAHHLLLDPDGVLWLGRPWDLPPVSVTGHNGNARSGPLCVSVVGDLAPGRERMGERQRAALAITLGGLVRGLELDVDRLKRPIDVGASRPGPDIDLAELAGSAVATAGKETADDSSSGPFGAGEDDAEGLLPCLFHDADDVPAAVRRLEAACGMDDDVADEDAGSAGGARAGASGFTLTGPLRRKLKRHVINLRQGEFSDSGAFCTTEADFEALVERWLRGWIAERGANETPRVLIYAHGGLNSEAAGLAHAASLIDWWLENGIYPIFFVWETGLIESVMQLIGERVPGGRGFGDDLRNAVAERRDASVESLIRQIGRSFWDIMKLSAERASENRSTSGAYQLARKLADLKGEHPTLECHAVGHSAGAIFQAHFLPVCHAGNRKVPFESLSLLAPACTVEQFREQLLPRIDGTRIKRLNLFNLDGETERRDHTVPLYGKSLLHLVSDGFEGRRDTPILGMERAIDADPALARSLGLGANERPDVNVVFSPSAADAHASGRAGATTHGGLSRDPLVLGSLARLMLPGAEARKVVEPGLTGIGARGSNGPLFEPLSARIDADTYATLFGPAPAPTGFGGGRVTAEVPAAVPDAPRPGARKALCIGIDDYPGRARLLYCVADSLAWQATLERLGFAVEPLLNREATYQGILDAIHRTVRGARAGDVVVIQYSGHGIQFHDANGDEVDAKDEALVPVDSAHQYFVSDDELWEALQAVADGVELYVFMDCCHSRSNSRAHARASEGTDRRARGIVAEPSMLDAHSRRLRARHGARGREPKTIESMRHVKFSACHDREEAFEERGQGNFTRAALAVLDELPPGMSNEAVRMAIEERFVPDARQQPGLECPTHRRREAFLGGIARD